MLPRVITYHSLRTALFYSQYKYTKKLDSGEYTLKLMLRSPSKKLLEKLKKTAMLLRHNIGSISVDVYTSQKDAITGGWFYLQTKNLLLKHLLTEMQVIATRFVFIPISFNGCQVVEAPTASPIAICIMQC